MAEVIALKADMGACQSATAVTQPDTEACILTITSLRARWVGGSRGEVEGTLIVVADGDLLPTRRVAIDREPKANGSIVQVGHQGSCRSLNAGAGSVLCRSVTAAPKGCRSWN